MLFRHREPQREEGDDQPPDPIAPSQNPERENLRTRQNEYVANDNHIIDTVASNTNFHEDVNSSASNQTLAGGNQPGQSTYQSTPNAGATNANADTQGTGPFGPTLNSQLRSVGTNGENPVQSVWETQANQRIEENRKKAENEKNKKKKARK